MFDYSAISKTSQRFLGVRGGGALNHVLNLCSTGKKSLDKRRKGNFYRKEFNDLGKRREKGTIESLRKKIERDKITSSKDGRLYVCVCCRGCRTMPSQKGDAQSKLKPRSEAN